MKVQELLKARKSKKNRHPTVNEIPFAVVQSGTGQDTVSYGAARVSEGSELETWKEKVRKANPDVAKGLQFNASMDDRNIIKAEIPGVEIDYGSFNLKTKKGTT